MRPTPKQQRTINDWWREYGDPMFKPDWNKIKLSVANARMHNLRVCEICITLLELGIPFATEVRLKCGARPDIVAPTHVQPIIEVLWSETNRDFIEKKAHKYPEELQGRWILHKAVGKYNADLIL